MSTIEVLCSFLSFIAGMTIKAVPKSDPNYFPDSNITVLSDNQELIAFLFKVRQRDLKITDYNKELIYPREKISLAELIDSCIEILEEPTGQIIIELERASQGEKLFRLSYAWLVTIRKQGRTLKRQLAWIRLTKTITSPADKV